MGSDKELAEKLGFLVAGFCAMHRKYEYEAICEIVAARLLELSSVAKRYSGESVTERTEEHD